MPAPKNHIPKLRHHKATGRAYVELDGQPIYFGRWDDPQSQQKYNALIGEWLANGRRLPQSTRSVPDLTIMEMVNRFLEHAETYYRRPDGTSTGEYSTFVHAVRPLLDLYGLTAAAEFGPLKLKAVRERMVGLKWCRNTVNRQVSRIRMIFRWAVENEMVPAEVYQALLAVRGLAKGRTEAREAPPVRAVPVETVKQTLPYLSDQVADMVWVQLHTGMRSGELVKMRGIDLDTGGDVWIYKPILHKTTHHEHERVIFIGPKARAIIEKYLRPGYIFVPNDGGERWDRTSYCRAIARACDRAFPPPADLARKRVRANGRKRERWEKTKDWRKRLGEKRWAELKSWRKAHAWHPHQLRHAAATELRKQFGLEAAQVVLGHAQMKISEVYAEKNQTLARQVVAQVG